MKVLPTLSVVFAALTLLVVDSGAAEPVTELLTEAQTAYLRGDIDSAKAKFESVIRLDPKNTVAIGYLRQIKMKEAEKGGGAERNLAKLIVPSVQFREAQLSAVLEALRQQASKLSEGKQVVNFVVQLPEEQAKTAITLSLSQVPFTEVLKYIGALANVTFTYDKYAIMVRPNGSAPAPAPVAKPEETAK